jgi:primosomal protein N' (replication factor Y) (superfamily II helicase)
MFYFQVLTPRLPQTFTYHSYKLVSVGSLVKINFNNRETTAIIISKSEKPKYDTKEILAILIDQAITEQQIDLCNWMADYYHCGVNKCIQLFLPKIIMKGIQPKHQETLKLNIELTTALDQTKRAKKQQELIALINDRGSVDREEIKTQFSSKIIKQLLEKGLITVKKGKLTNPINHSAFSVELSAKELTQDQQNALDTITKSENIITLLHGITGSGKTEIYLRLIREKIKKGEQCLLLVPEIALTTQLINYFASEFGDTLAVLHSKVSDGERLQQWHRIHQQEAKLIMGSRSALFTPWKNLSLIIMDEEHEWTYKQENIPRYHTRTVAKKLIEIQSEELKIKNKEKNIQHSAFSIQHHQLILGSATPSIETYYTATNNPTWNYIELKTRANKSVLSPVTLVDLRHEYEKKNYSMISDELKDALQCTLERGEQAILFLNKRGMASSITCRECGYSPVCSQCDVTLTYHEKGQKSPNYNLRFSNYLLCHYCSTVSGMISQCPKCQSVAIKQLGTGTQKAVQQIQELFPTAGIIRADQDTTRGKKDFEKLYNKMVNGEADIMVGTQMVSKGLDLPNITLVGVLLADIGLHFPSFRSSEKVFQLLTQVAGRAGRHKPGRVIIQTYNPDHISLQSAKSHDYKKFYNHEIKLREQFNCPPFSETIQLTFAHPDKKIAYEECINLYETINQREHRNLKTPITNYQLPITSYAPHIFPRLHNKYIWHIFLRGKKLKAILNQLDLKEWKIDIDPN